MSAGHVWMERRLPLRRGHEDRTSSLHHIACNKAALHSHAHMMAVMMPAGSKRDAAGGWATLWRQQAMQVRTCAPPAAAAHAPQPPPLPWALTRHVSLELWEETQGAEEGAGAQASERQQAVGAGTAAAADQGMPCCCAVEPSRHPAGVHSSQTRILRWRLPGSGRSGTGGWFAPRLAGLHGTGRDGGRHGCWHSAVEGCTRPRGPVAHVLAACRSQLQSLPPAQVVGAPTLDVLIVEAAQLGDGHGVDAPAAGQFALGGRGEVER